LNKDQEEKNKKRFYDVDKFRQVNAETQRKAGRFRRILERVTGSFSSAQGVFIAILLPPLVMFGSVIVIIYGLYLGPLVFLGFVTAGLVGLTLLVEKKFGASDRFESPDFLKRTLGQVVGFALALGLIVLLVMLAKLPFHI